MIPIVGTILVSEMKSSHRNFVIGALILCILFMAAGWIVFVVIDGELDGFTGYERIEAQRFHDKTSLDMTLCRTRIVKRNDGSLDFELYTWWGIAIPGKSVMWECDNRYESWLSKWNP